MSAQSPPTLTSAAPGDPLRPEPVTSVANKNIFRRHPLLAFFTRRLALAVPLLFIVSILTFIIVALIPGNPAALILGGSGNVQSYAAIDAQLGLDKPLPVQYWNWLTRLFHGDLGESIFTHQSVVQELTQRLGVTVALVVGAVFLASVAGVLLGTLAACSRRTVRRIIDVITWAGFAVPGFWLAYLLVSTFAMHIKLLPGSGYVPFGTSPSAWFSSLVLPVITLAVPGATAVAKQTRDSMDHVLGLEYITTLRADGIPQRSVVLRHALRNAALPILTMIGLIFVGMLGGTVVVEQVFALPGLGSLVLQAASSHDLPVLEGAVLYFAIIVIAVNLVIDLLYGWLDPRVRVQ